MRERQGVCGGEPKAAAGITSHAAQSPPSQAQPEAIMACEPNKSPIATAQRAACKGDPSTLHASMEKAKLDLNWGASCLQADAPDAAKRPHTQSAWWGRGSLVAWDDAKLMQAGEPSTHAMPAPSYHPATTSYLPSAAQRGAQHGMKRKGKGKGKGRIFKRNE